MALFAPRPLPPPPPPNIRRGPVGTWGLGRGRFALGSDSEAPSPRAQLIECYIYMLGGGRGGRAIICKKSGS